MNSKKLRIINQNADQFAPMIEEFKTTKVVKGSRLIARGETHVNGIEIDPNKFYTWNSPVRIINHRKKLKNYYKKYGDKYLYKYQEWFAAHSQRMKALYPDQFVEETNQ